MSDKIDETYRRPASETEIFEAPFLAREEVDAGYQNALKVIDQQRHEQWLNTIMQGGRGVPRQGGQPTAWERYQNLTRRRGEVLADYRRWQEANPEEPKADPAGDPAVPDSTLGITVDEGEAEEPYHGANDWRGPALGEVIGNAAMRESAEV